MAQSPVSQPVVVKPGSQAPNPTSGSQRPPTGQQKKTEGTPYDFNDLRFPLNVGHTEKHLHWIKFIPCVQNKSGYNVETTNTLGLADGNRQNLGGQLGSSSSAVNVIGKTKEGLTDAGLITGAFATLGAIGAAADALKGSDPADLALAPFKAAGGAAGGAGIGLFGLAAIKSINLTRKTKRAAASIALYMPDTVNQTVVNDYDQVSLTQALGTAGLVMQAGSGAIAGAGDFLTGKGLGQTPGSAAAGTAEVAGALAEKTGAFGQGITDVLLFSAGYAQNPQVELLFKTIQNREFLFDFKFVPRNKSEAETIIKIIQAFRFFAAPEIPTSGSGRYFIPPSEFDIQFMVGSNPNLNLPKISTCVLQGIDVNYGSAGQWTAFKDGMPVEIAMQLRFKEVEIMHKELIKQGF